MKEQSFSYPVGDRANRYGNGEGILIVSTETENAHNLVNYSKKPHICAKWDKVLLIVTV